jgi:hypothetical protein
MALNAKMGTSPPFSEFGAYAGSVSTTSFAINDAFVNATSGPAYCFRIVSPVSQTTAALTIYAYLSTKTGSPTAVHASVYAGPSGVMDAQRPDTGAALATSAAVDVSAQADDSWTTFSIASISLTAGATYWVVIHNATATPASNYPTYWTRRWNGNSALARFAAYTTANGFTSDPTIVSAGSEFVACMKFSDGSFLGNPYVVSTAHASNTNDRGARFVFDADTRVAGIHNSTVGGLQNANLTAVKVYQGATEIASITPDLSQMTNGGPMYFSDVLTFTGGVAYDVVGKYGGNATAGWRVDAGMSPPADVAACMASQVQYVDGATPGSYTAVDGLCAIAIMLNNIPGGASGGQTSYIWGG